MREAIGYHDSASDVFPRSLHEASPGAMYKVVGALEADESWLSSLILVPMNSS